VTQLPRDVPRPPGLRRGVSALSVALLAVGAGCALVAPAQAAASRVAVSQPLVVLLSDHVARTRPDAQARRIESVDARRPLTGVRTVLPVLGKARSRGGNSWVRVRLPGRPNGHGGWIRALKTRRTATGWHIVLKLSARRVTVYHHGRVARRFPAVVGNPWTPTPLGRFFIEEALALPSQHSGPFALATSARSNVLQEFEGGPGQIALHGTNGLSGALGTAASHGCVRLSTRTITWLAQRIGSGVPLTITR
jgi:lipoprotein-anchoring transpeptidase ErfK/SrfK